MEEEPMTTDERDRWQQKRRHGRWAYILRHGILTKGSFFGLVMSVVNRDHTPWGLASTFAVNATIYGVIIGWLQWSAEEARFKLGSTHHEMEEETTCLDCGGIIPAGQHVCPLCGWTYKEETPP